ncbi:alpha/beta hydrolase [Lactovum odontotermitis]
MNKKKVWKRLRVIIVALIALILAADIGATFYFFHVSQARYNGKVTELKKTSKNYSLLAEFAAYKKTTKKITNDGIKLVAWYVPAASKTNKTVIVVHGYHSSKEAMRQYAVLYHQLGYNVLMPDNRAAGESGGQIISYGYHDKFDIIAWANTLIKADSKADLTLFGVSMGAATVMMASGEPTLPVNVHQIIEDCGYTSVWDETAYQAKQMYNLPKFPLIYEVSAMSKIRDGWTYGEASSVKALAQNSRPMLFIHGSKDTYVPTKMVYQNYAADKDKEKQLLIVKGAAHAKSFETEPELYRKTVSEFLEKYDNY